jgi:hypothetical protein
MRNFPLLTIQLGLLRMMIVTHVESPYFHVAALQHCFSVCANYVSSLLTVSQRAAFASSLTERDLNDYGSYADTIVDVNGIDIVVRFANGTELLDAEL